MQHPNWRGIFAIPLTPWTNSDLIDEEVLREEIEFIVARCAGIVSPVLVSEFQALSEDERKTMMRVPIEQAKGRVPVIVNVAGVSTPQAVAFAHHARELGASGVIAMPPYVLKPDFDVTYAYYQKISEAAQLPVMIQNANLAPLTTDQVIRLCDEIPNVKWVKEEVPPNPHSIGKLCARRSPNVHGVLGGLGGQYLITEHQRGVSGSIVACEYCDVVAQLWDALEAGDKPRQSDIFERLLPAVLLESLLGMAFAKRVMMKRGIFKNDRMRMQTANHLGKEDLIEIDRVHERLEMYLKTGN